MQDYFPAKLALGTQFCNRKNEKQFLKDNIAQGRHTVLIAPRRYGKSSLVIKVIDELKLPFASIDLFLAHDDRTVTKRIMEGISQAVSSIMPLNQKFLNKLQQLFTKFRISLTAQGFSLEGAWETGHADAVDQILLGLTALAKLAKEQNQKIIFFIDEFQDIREAGSAKSIQGAIRHVAQETSDIIFIFSGSNRRLLLDLFDDKSKPLYMLCDKLAVERMSLQDYYPHLQNLAKKKWQQALPDFLLEKILSCAELHPYYVNLLCHELWKIEKMPALEDIFTSWEQCFDAHQDRLVAELEKLTTKQQDILKALAVNPVSQPTGQRFAGGVEKAASTINQALKVLFDKDMVYRISKTDDCLPQCPVGQIRVLDPLLAYALRKYA